DLWRVYAGALERLLSSAFELFPQDPAELEITIRDMPDDEFRRFLSAMNAGLRDQITTIYDLETAALRDAKPDATAQNFVIMLDACEGRLLGPTAPRDGTVPTPPPDPRNYLTLNLWNCFEQLDAVLFPVESVANVGERDIVEIHRISAADAQIAFSKRRTDWKVSGDAVGHFGGFLKRSWRSNDILWGRLDGCCRLLDVLLDGDRVREMVEGTPAHLHDRFFESNGEWKAGMQAASVFPHCPPATAAKLDAWVDDLLGADSEKSKAALAELPDIRKTLIEAEQYEILHEDLADVFEDQYRDEADWNNADLDSEPGSETEDPLPVATEQYLDPGHVQSAAYERAQRRLQAIVAQPAKPAASPMETPLGTYFKTYNVGAEPLNTAIPPALLIHWATQAALLLRTCLFNSFPGPGAVFQRNRLFKFVVEWPLRVVHWFTGLWLSEPRGLRTKVAFAAITTLALGVVIFLFDHRSLLGVLLLIVLPALILFVMTRFGWITGTRRPEPSQWSSRRLIGVAAAVICGVLAVVLALLTVWSVSPDREILGIQFSEVEEISFLRADSKWFPILAPYGVVLLAALSYLWWRFSKPPIPRRVEVAHREPSATPAISQPTDVPVTQAPLGAPRNEG
ncbi:MAG TPA: DUF3376 domain-containing protein, partial [Thermomicrobiales bacterium]|nr:DUF3376 domain-containing protein [Thermomicrobiales bacterium]